MKGEKLKNWLSNIMPHTVLFVVLSAFTLKPLLNSLVYQSTLTEDDFKSQRKSGRMG
ncbi:hypothetical protein J4727_11190 [Providencia rettgeri]|uniref:Uncharacterized protein n=1 Tax=Providencia rettgeri TaxID=587 RepID=A0A939NBE8_PRORE|nr:hypothetical protein [Providencia rettgeri]